MRLSALITLLLLPVAADPPTWWTDGIPPVIPPGATENNQGPANIGQAKHMADMALKALELKDKVLSDTIRQKLTIRQPNPTNPTGPLLKEIIKHRFALPNPLPADWAQSQRAPLLLGQLKAISAPFYAALNLQNPSWLAEQLTLNGTSNPGSI